MSIDIPARGPSRRTVLAGTSAVSLAALLTGCQTYGEPSAPTPVEPPVAASPGGGAGPSPSPSGRAPSDRATADETGAPADEAPALASTADIPVGGGKIFEQQGVVVTQPQAGSIKAFSAKCTHQGCTVTSVSGGTINCACHNSRFDIADGSVKSGPASRPLPAAGVTVSGEKIRLG
jgi:Rieske Fe-S protein